MTYSRPLGHTVAVSQVKPNLSASSAGSVSANYEVIVDQSPEEGILRPSSTTTLRNFAFFMTYSTPATELFWAKIMENQRQVGLVPMVRLRKRKVTDMLAASLRKKVGWLGPFARKTTLLADTSFLAFDDRSPFHCSEGVDRNQVKRTFCNWLKKQRGTESIWITEPEEEAAWAGDQGFEQFYTLPIAQIKLDGIQSLKEYVAGLSKKRRSNYRRDRERFASAGATIETHEGPLFDKPELAKKLVACLRASEKHSSLIAPYNDVLIHNEAFIAQPQTILTAWVNHRLVGFMSFLQDGNRLLQCHGGLDYELSHEVQAYHNLMYAAIELALSRSCQSVGMGPLNNETKRRTANVLRPMVGNLWMRNPLDGLLAKKLFIKNFGVYRGPFA